MSGSAIASSVAVSIGFPVACEMSAAAWANRSSWRSWYATILSSP